MSQMRPNPVQTMSQVLAPTPQSRVFMPVNPGVHGMNSSQPTSPTHPAAPVQLPAAPAPPPATVQTVDTSNVPGKLMFSLG